MALFLQKGFTAKAQKKGEAPMKGEITIPEVLDLIKEIRQKPESIFEMIRADVGETVGHYFSVKERPLLQEKTIRLSFNDREQQ